jgi:hypothetical protein
MYGDVNYDIREHLAVLSVGGRGWNKEVNIVSWNGGPAKIDIRDWNEDHTRCAKGITLTRDEAEALMLALQKRDSEKGACL